MGNKKKSKAAKAGKDSKGKPKKSRGSRLDREQVRRDYPYRYFGAHPKKSRTTFRVYAPEATAVYLLREGKDWSRDAEPMEATGDGVWELVVRKNLVGTGYKYRIVNDHDYLDRTYDKDRIDPFSRQLVVSHGPGGSRTYHSLVVDPKSFEWSNKHHERGPRPMSIYELHLSAFLDAGYREIAEKIVGHVGYLGFTHVQIMPPLQTPIHESWGYLIGCPYALNERYGSVDDFKWMVNHLHAHDIGVIVDVPLGFGIQDWDCGLSTYDGTDLYHHVGPRGWNMQWQSRIYNTTKPYVKDYLIGVCTYLHDELGVDGVRVDAVASQLFFDYDRGNWDWPRNDREKISQADWEIFNGVGGDMHLPDRGYWISEATDFDGLRFYRDLHLRLKHTAPDFFTIAEESRRVFKRLAVPVEQGGLGFDYAQNMGEMHRVRKYLKYPVEQRRIEEVDGILFQDVEETFVNAMNTHDECANGRTRLVTELGNHVQLIGLAALCWFRAGAPMIFMGDEFCEEGYFDVWRQLDWTKTGPHAAMHQQQMTFNIHDLNHLLRTEPALRRQHASSMQRVGSNNERKWFAFARWADPEGQDHREDLVYVRNETPWAQEQHCEVHVPMSGEYRVIYNSIDERYIGVQEYNRHDPYWSIHADGNICWLSLQPYQNLVLKLVR